MNETSACGFDATFLYKGDPVGIFKCGSRKEKYLESKEEEGAYIF